MHYLASLLCTEGASSNLNMHISALARDMSVIKHALDSSLNKLCVDALTLQIGPVELPLAS